MILRGILKRKKKRTTRVFQDSIVQLHRRVVKELFGKFGLAVEEHRARAFGAACAAQIELLRPDSLWINDYNASRIISDYPGLVPAQIIYDSHELWSHRNRPFLKGAFARYVGVAVIARESTRIARCSTIVSVSTGIQDVLKSRQEKFALAGSHSGSRPNSPSFVLVRNIPAQPNPARRASTRVRNTMSSALELATSEVKAFEVFYTGLITINRCLPQLIDAAALASRYEERPRIRINLLGRTSGDTISQLKHMASLHGVPLLHHEPVDSDQVVPTLRACADLCFVGVFPEVESYRLALPNKFFEALFSTRHVLYPALPEMCREAQGQPGMTQYVPTSVSSLAEALIEALPAAGTRYNRDLRHLDDTPVILNALNNEA